MQFSQSGGTGFSRNNPFSDNRTTHIEELEPRLLLSGTVYIIDTLEDVKANDGYVSLREAIEASNNNPGYHNSSADAPSGSYTETDIIRFAPELFANGPAVLHNQLGIWRLSGDLRIEGPGSDLLTIDAGGTDAPFAFYPTNLQHHDSTNAHMSGVTLSNAYRGSSTWGAISGSAIHNHASLIMEDCLISNNSGTGMVAAVANFGHLELRGCEFRGNTMQDTLYEPSAGSALVTEDDSTTLVHECIFADNYGYTTGAIYNCGNMTITDSIIANNQSKLDEDEISSTTGGIDNHYKMEIYNSLFIGNNSALNGGAVSNHRDLIVDSCSFIENSADASGGAIYNGLNGESTLINSTFVHNTANEAGGVVFNDCYYFPAGIDNPTGPSIASGVVTAINCTFASNKAMLNGSVFYSITKHEIQSEANIYNCILALNEAGDDMEIVGEYNGANNLIGIDPHFVGNPSDGGDGLVNIPSPITPRPYWPDPINERINNFSGDLRLMPDSPAIDAGDNTLAVDATGEPLATDFEGLDRFYGGSVDIGAYENNGQIQIETPSTQVTTHLDIVNQYDGYISLREAIEYASITTGNAITIDPSLTGLDMVIWGDSFVLNRNLSIDASAAPGFTVVENNESIAFIIAEGIEVSIAALSIRSTDVMRRSLTNGCIENNGILTLDSCILWSSDYGIVNNGQLDMTDCDISQTRQALLSHGPTIATGCVFRDGGGIESYTGDITLYECRITNVISSLGFGQVTKIFNSIIIDFGYDITVGGDFYMENTEISSYSMTLLRSYGNSELVNCVLHNIRRSSGASLMRINKGDTTLRNCTLSLVDATYWHEDYSPVIYITPDEASLTMNNTIVAFKESPNGVDMISGEYSGQNNFVGGDPLFVCNPTDGGDGFGDDSRTFDIDESLNDDFGDLRLRPDSPCIDAGQNSLAVYPDGADITTDCNGNPRIVNALVDIGAMEYQSFKGDANGDETVDLKDFVILKQCYGLREGASVAEGDFNGDGMVNLDDFIILKQNYETSLQSQSNPRVPAAAAAAAPSEEYALEAKPATKPDLNPIGMLSWSAPLEHLSSAMPILDIVQII